METSKTDGKPSSWRILKILLPVAVVIALAISGVSLWLGSQQCVFCPNPDIVFVNSVTLGSNGWVTFNMTGAQNPNFNFVIHTVKAYNGSNVDPSTTPLGAVYPSANNVVPPKGKIILSFQFQGITWQHAVKYTFAILTPQGYGIMVQQCLNGCP